MYIYTRGELSQGAAGERVQGSVCSLRLTRMDGMCLSVCLRRIRVSLGSRQLYAIRDSGSSYGNPSPLENPSGEQVLGVMTGWCVVL